MSIHALGWTVLGLVIGWLAAKWLFGIDAGQFFGVVVGCVAARAVQAWYRDKGKIVDGHSAPGSRHRA